MASFNPGTPAPVGFPNFPTVAGTSAPRSSNPAITLIDAGVNLLGDYFLNKGKRKEEERLIAEQRRLVELVAQEQKLRLAVLAQNTRDQDAQIPFEISLPSTSGPGAFFLPAGNAPVDDSTAVDAPGAGSLNVINLGIIALILVAILASR